MARQRRRVVSESTPPSHNLLRQRSKSYQLRSSPIAPKDHSVSPHYSSIFQDRDTQRQVLVPLQQNLRRLPSRRNISMPVPILPNLEYHGLGRKRKRVASGIENRNAMPRHRTPSGRPSAKRTRSTRGDSDADEEEGDRYTEIDEDEEDDDVAMEVDFESDVYFLQTAPQWRLAQLQKKELCRLLRSLSPRRSTEELTKQDLINALLSFRQRGNGPPPSPETPYPPPSSPPLTATSEDESQLKLEKYNRPMIGLRRRATTDNQAFQSPVKQRLPSLRTKDRSFSMSHLGASGKRASSGSSSEELVTPCTPPQTPAARTRKASQTQGGKKQVEFISPPSLSHSESSSSSSNKVANPSPRRLRSRQKDAPTVEQSSEGRDGRTRRVKGGVNSSETPQSSEDEGEDEGEQSQDDEESQRSERLRTLRPRKQRRESESSLTELMPEDDEEQEEDIEESDGSEEQSEEEEEEQEPPLRKRLRPLPGRIEEDDAHDADKEESANEEDEEEETVDDSAEEEVEEIIAPKILRNGKVVGVDDPDEEEEGEDEDEVMQTADEAEEEVDELDEEVDEVLEDDDVDESSDLDVDLSSATQKSLTRLNRPVLVQLCDSRELESDGLTKAQLAKTLIKWRDAAAKQDSTQTIKQGSATPQHRGRRKSASTTPTTPATPLLLRSAASTVIHESDPSTPTPGMEVLQSSGGLRLQHQENEPELELDLESLGLEDREIPPDKLEKKEKIGSGGFKDVFVGKLRGRVKVAIAEFRSQLTPMDIKELKLLSDFDHPNVVRFLGVSIPENSKETGTPVMIVSELCTNGDLFDYIRNVSAPTLHKVIGLMLDIARGIEYLHLHKPSIIHRDAKSSNILITAKVTAKITDFGLAKVKQSTRSMVRSLVGTVNWQAPELWSPTPKYGHKVDVFSCACVFWEMMQWKSAVKKFPWEGMNEHAIYDLVGAKRQRPSVAGLKKTWCPEIVELTERMWAHDPADRPTMSEVVEELKRLHAEY